MQKLLYLDTARLGQMSRPAYHALSNFARFTHEHGCTLYQTQLLREGFDSWPDLLRRTYPGLSPWGGVFRLRANLRRLVETSTAKNVWLTSRPASLMKLGALLLTGACRRVLVTDTCWPAYRQILDHELQRTPAETTTVRIRRKALREAATANELIEHLVSEFVRRQCDGLFVPLVDNRGIRLPVADLVGRLRAEADLRFVVVDAAQAMGHVPLAREIDSCDFVFGGAHKWLRAGSPLGIGFAGRTGSQSFITQSMAQWRSHRSIDDPLLEFTDELTTGVGNPFGETVAVAPLFVTAAATHEALSTQLANEAARRVERQFVSDLAVGAGWRPLPVHSSLASQILLLERAPAQRSALPPEDVQRRLLKQGVAATVDPRGLLRLSLPHAGLTRADHQQLATGLHAAARSSPRAVVPARLLPQETWQTPLFRAM